MNHWHVYLLAAQQTPETQGQFRFRGQMFSGFQPDTAPRTSFSRSFEEFVADLEMLDRLFIELDGSFVWRGPTIDEQPQWQVDGNISDKQDRVFVVELKGHSQTGAENELKASTEILMNHLNWPTQSMYVEIAEAGFLPRSWLLFGLDRQGVRIILPASLKRVLRIFDDQLKWAH